MPTCHQILAPVFLTDYFGDTRGRAAGDLVILDNAGALPGLTSLPAFDALQKDTIFAAAITKREAARVAGRDPGAVQFVTADAGNPAG